MIITLKYPKLQWVGINSIILGINKNELQMILLKSHKVMDGRLQFKFKDTELKHFTFILRRLNKSTSNRDMNEDIFLYS